MKTVFSLLAVLSLSIVAFAAQQDEEFVTTAETAPAVNTEATPAVENAVRVSLSEDGELSGMVFKTVDDRQEPVTAKVTISKLNGETISSDMTGDDGTFKFDSIEPGYYTIITVGQGHFGDQTVDVTSYNEAYTAQVPVEVGGFSGGFAPSGGFDSGVVYSDFQSAPISTFSGGCATGTCGSSSFSSGGLGTCGSCGGCSGGGGGLFRGGFSGGGGGLRSLIPFVGLAGLAGLGGDDDDDASPAL